MVYAPVEVLLLALLAVVAEAETFTDINPSRRLRCCQPGTGGEADAPKYALLLEDDRRRLRWWQILRESAHRQMKGGRTHPPQAIATSDLTFAHHSA